MSERKVLVVQPEDERKSFSGVGDIYRYVATSEETDGAYFMIHCTVSPGGGPPPHIQTREEEGFFILEGEVTFFTDDGPVVAKKGTLINVPKGAKHNFKNVSDSTAEMLFWFSPTALEGLFDRMADGEWDPEKFEKDYGVKYFLSE
jgi:quercetin dioxygenase-like cupin family protein